MNRQRVLTAWIDSINRCVDVWGYIIPHTRIVAFAKCLWDVCVRRVDLCDTTNKCSNVGFRLLPNIERGSVQKRVCMEFNSRESRQANDNFIQITPFHFVPLLVLPAGSTPMHALPPAQQTKKGPAAGLDSPMIRRIGESFLGRFSSCLTTLRSRLRRTRRSPTR